MVIIACCARCADVPGVPSVEELPALPAACSPGYAGIIVRDGYAGYGHLTDALHACAGPTCSGI